MCCGLTRKRSAAGGRCRRSSRSPPTSTRCWRPSTRRSAPGRTARQHAPALPDLRASYAALERAAPDDPDSAALLVEIDEIVDAANGLAALAGLESGDEESG